MPARNPGNFLELSSTPLLRKVKAKLASELSASCGVFNFESSYSGAAEAKEGSEGSMKSQLKFALFVALGTGVLGAGAAAQEQSRNIGGQAQVQYAAFDPNQAGRLVQVDHRRRCDGDGDRDDRGCYYQYQYPALPRQRVLQQRILCNACARAVLPAQRRLVRPRRTLACL